MGCRPRHTTLLRIIAAIAIAIAAGREPTRAHAQECDEPVVCGDLIADAAKGDTCYCGNIVTPKGGCSTGYEMFWFGAQYMAWQRDGFALPALVTASPIGTPDDDRGILGLPTTTVLAGDQVVSDHWRGGFGIDGGYWIDPAAGFGIGANFFNAGRDSYGFAIGPDNTQTFARPFFNAQTDAQDASLINEPNVFSGTISGSAFDDFQGAGGWLQSCVWARGNGCAAGGSARVSVLGGYRYYHHDSLVFLREQFVVLPGANLPGTPDGTLHIGLEKFAGRNEFHGAEVGFEGRFQRCRWWCEGLAAVAIGGSRRVMFVEGAQLNDANPSDDVIPDPERGVLLVSGITNFGRYTDDEFQAIPRFRVGAGWQVNEWLGVKFGYNVVIWNIVQAADHLPPGLAVDPRNLPTIVPGGGPEPVFPGLRDTTMVAHGLDLGLELSF